jgi:hypothetical protein
MAKVSRHTRLTQQYSVRQRLCAGTVAACECSCKCSVVLSVLDLRSDTRFTKGCAQASLLPVSNGVIFRCSCTRSKSSLMFEVAE